MMQDHEEIFQRLSSFERNKIMGPLNLFLFVSTSCPLKCSFCARRVYLDLKNGKETDIDRFAAISLFGLDPKTFSLVGAGIALGAKELADEIDKKKGARAASDNIDGIINGSGPLDYSNYGRLSEGVKKFSREIRISLYAYSILKIREKIASDMGRRMPLDTYLRVIREAAGLGVKNVYLTGAVGEPLSDRDFLVEIMKEVRKYTLTGHLTTNGYLADREFAELLVEMEWPSVIVSIDGARAETHDRLRGRNGSFKRAFSFLRQLTEVRRGAKKTYPRITVSFVVNRLNYSEIIDHLELMAEAGADSVYYSPIRIYSDDARELLTLRNGDETELKELIEKGKPRWMDAGVENNIGSISDWPESYGLGPCVRPEKGIFEDVVSFTAWNGPPTRDNVTLDRIKCAEPWLSMAVDANGSVLQCCVSSIPLINMNVTDHSLGYIWNSARYHHLRDHFIGGKLPYECENHCLPPVMEDQKKLIAGFRETKRASEIKCRGPIASTIERVDNEIARLTGIDMKRRIREIHDKISKN